MAGPSYPIKLALVMNFMSLVREENATVLVWILRQKKHHTRMTSDHIRICFYTAEREQRRFSVCFTMIDSLKAPVNLRIFLAYYNFNNTILGKSKCLKMLDRE